MLLFQICYILPQKNTMIYGYIRVSSDKQTVENQRASLVLMELAYPVTSEQLPLPPNNHRKPKLLWLDTGIVYYYAGVRSEIFDESDIMSVWKGRVAENIVAQELIADNYGFGIRHSAHQQIPAGHLISDSLQYMM